MSRIIHLLDKRVALHQPEGGFQTSIDAVLLAAACPVQAGETVLDLGCGVGAAGLCVLQRQPAAQLSGVELLAREAALAQENAALNNRQAEIMQADIRNWQPPQRYDHVICNPPYLKAGAHLNSPDAAKARAMGHVEEGTSLQDWIKAAHQAVKSKGSLTMIHRADTLDALILALGKRFGALELIPLWPKEGRPARRIILRARKDRQTPLTLHPGLILHQAGGNYTPQAEKILRAARPLF